MTEAVQVDASGGILTVTLKHPEKKSALTSAMYAAMSDALERAEVDPSVRVVLFHGDGDSFTTGNDISEFSAASAGKSNEERQSTRFIRNLTRAGKPLVAAVQGNAVGVGTTMLLHCDLVFLADTARPAKSLLRVRPDR
ncbi:enoyl-CoA hydratase-related protein [Bradyrhizobium sp.]|uniref:enoyl-CoA hydratase-related protein n=1 Tax=Bradyrhizobium sp. TaxID=376 RepID=UPI002DDDBC2A|nr:enoyl-CoA hydratase-related protein [Bradyrhizobium sp.]HEV2160552.1 enoyl-CoA hydratase-related protein [Bradyrhizobium sp.]